MIAVVILYRVICAIVDLFLIALALGAVFWASREVARTVRNRVALRRCPLPRRPLPSLPVDGEPLGEDEDGESEQFAALIWTYRNESIPEPGYRAGTERGTA